MLPGAFALVERSLRVDTRGRSTHLIRLALMVGIYFALCNELITSILVGAPGLHFFNSIAFLDIVFLTLLGVGFFSSVITEEKEEDTLGLMLMAGISPLGILAGKSVGGLFQAMLLIAVQYPFILLAVTMGGVTREQVFAFTIALLAYLVFLAGFGLLCSTLFPSNKVSARWMGIGLFMYFFVTGIAMSYAHEHARAVVNGESSAFSEFFWMMVKAIGQMSIFLQMEQILSTGYGGSVLNIQFFSNIAMGILCAGLSLLFFGVAARSPSSEATTRGLVARRRAFFRFTAGRVWINPFFWKDFYFVAGGTGMTLLRTAFFAGLGLLPVLGGLLWESTEEDWLGISISLLLFLGSINCSSVLARSMQDEIRGQTLSSLMMLPRSPTEIIYSKYSGALMGWIPSAVIGPMMLFTSKTFRDGLVDIFDHMFGPTNFNQFAMICLGIVICVLFFALTPHFAAFVATYIRWGAVPLAIGLTFAVYMGLMMSIMTASLLFSNMSESWGLLMMFLVAVFLFSICAACHIGVLLRVQALAAK